MAVHTFCIGVALIYQYSNLEANVIRKCIQHKVPA